MLVSNKYKQLYECRLPPQAMRFHQDPVPESDPQGYSGPAIPELLKPMHTAPCLTKVPFHHAPVFYYAYTTVFFMIILFIHLQLYLNKPARVLPPFPDLFSPFFSAD